ncbi:hypothetical protein KP509_02G006400 [Ceratopteris richardii]|uniref:Bifunctional inhibitor/plant lipid transfer protein/seed storage helical domain-containing protein n=1 Tax=Ceratopteris richardii TaxID=49495 RepID=A0A8T2VAD6_CERRI|nr:hypothetical protein KP509_02G006400 [Ceratopteris richardii]
MENGGHQVAMVLIVIMSLWLAWDGVEAGVSCAAVRSSLAPCVGFLLGLKEHPPARCCRGVRSLYAMTKSSRQYRITACSCITSLAASVPSQLKASSVAALPKSCGVRLSYQITPSTNCNRIG